jgi:hypothetical protein
MKVMAPALGFLILAASSVSAQESLVGKYAGTFVLQSTSRGVLAIPISLEITSAADGKLQAKAIRSQQSRIGEGCAGEYKLAGTYKGNNIRMKSEPGGPAKDCILNFRLVADGKKLKGKMNRFDVDFTK